MPFILSRQLAKHRHGIHLFSAPGLLRRAGALSPNRDREMTRIQFRTVIDSAIGSARGQLNVDERA